MPWKLPTPEEIKSGEVKTVKNSSKLTKALLIIGTLVALSGLFSHAHAAEYSQEAYNNCKQQGLTDPQQIQACAKDQDGNWTNLDGFKQCMKENNDVDQCHMLSGNEQSYLCWKPNAVTPTGGCTYTRDPKMQRLQEMNNNFHHQEELFKQQHGMSTEDYDRNVLRENPGVQCSTDDQACLDANGM